MDLLQDFLNQLQYTERAVPYNLVNTLAYAAIALLAIYVIYVLFKKLKINIDEKFFYAILPFVLFGGILRVYVDAAILPHYFWFVTPGIYLLTFFLVLGLIFISLFCQRKWEVSLTKTLRASGYCISAVAFFFLAPRISQALFGIAIIALAGVGLLVFLGWRRLTKKSASALGIITVFSQCLDGGASFIGVQFAGYSGQHVFENLVFSNFGPVFFYIIKLVFVIALVEIVERELGENKDAPLKTYVLLLVTIFGLAPGVRDLMRIVCAT